MGEIAKLFEDWSWSWMPKYKRELGETIEDELQKIREQADLNAIHLGRLETQKSPEPLPCDKNGHDLQPGDLVRKKLPPYYGIVEDILEHEIWGWWEDGGYTYYSRKVVTFVLRPEKQDC